MGMLNGHEFGEPLAPPPKEIALTHEQMIPDVIHLEPKHEEQYLKDESKRAWKETKSTLGKPPPHTPSNVYGENIQPENKGGLGFQLPKFPRKPKGPGPLSPQKAQAEPPMPETPEGRVNPRARAHR